ncbi:hypothetical protein [Bifidobacterium olomucense]|uniref:Uncharacterized protein n=1 Tax=Bifidobacterium olomucense TaxID=2675324 RepID=A0A7Y0HVC0_9BIFI|nr:hypothetical protein [Bifidobacterium sp. DSM 109959]NMM98115.1 hypothetical protein [Bifidobacterium sp. DSM 109959]
MLSKGEAAAVLSIIMGHHGNAQWNDLQLESFWSELLPNMTQQEALEAVRRFYRANDSGRWCGSGDVNAMVRRIRNERKPSEAQIGRECEAQGLTGDAAWLYRRQRMLGRQPDDASRIVAGSRDPLQLPPAKSRKRREGGGFIGGLGLGDVLG